MHMFLSSCNENKRKVSWIISTIGTEVIVAGGTTARDENDHGLITGRTEIFNIGKGEWRSGEWVVHVMHPVIRRTIKVSVPNVDTLFTRWSCMKSSLETMSYLIHSIPDGPTASPGRGSYARQHQHVCGRLVEQRVPRNSVRRPRWQLGAFRERSH